MLLLLEGIILIPLWAMAALPVLFFEDRTPLPVSPIGVCGQYE